MIEFFKNSELAKWMLFMAVWILIFVFLKQLKEGYVFIFFGITFFAIGIVFVVGGIELNTIK